MVWRGNGRGGSAVCNRLCWRCRAERRLVVGAEHPMEKRLPRAESGTFDGDNGRRGRRAEREILSELCANERRKKYPREIFHAVAGLRTLPRRPVQAMV